MAETLHLKDIHGESYKADLQAAEAEINNKREEDNSAKLDNFLQQYGRLPTPKEYKFSKGPEMFTNRLIPAPQHGREQRHDSKDVSEDVSEDDSRDNNGLNNGEVTDSSLDSDYDDY